METAYHDMSALTKGVFHDIQVKQGHNGVFLVPRPSESKFDQMTTISAHQDFLSERFTARHSAESKLQCVTRKDTD